MRATASDLAQVYAIIRNSFLEPVPLGIAAFSARLTSMELVVARIIEDAILMLLAYCSRQHEPLRLPFALVRSRSLSLALARYHCD